MNPPPLSPTRPLRPRRWLRRLLVLAVVLLLLGLFHGWILQGCAWFLINDDPPAPATSYVLPLRGGECWFEAARQCRSGQATQCLYLGHRQDLAEKYQAVPREEDVLRLLLKKRGVDPESLIIIEADSTTDFGCLKSLSAWLEAHPDAQVGLLFPRLGSAQCRITLDAALPSGLRGRVHLQSVRNPDYDETNWWRHKYGLLDTLNGFLSLAYTRVNGPTVREKPTWNPDQYEESLRR